MPAGLIALIPRDRQAFRKRHDVLPARGRAWDGATRAVPHFDAAALMLDTPLESRQQGLKGRLRETRGPYVLV